MNEIEFSGVVSRHTVAIQRLSRDPKKVAFTTAVLVSLDGICCLATSAHCLDSLPEGRVAVYYEQVDGRTDPVRDWQQITGRMRFHNGSRTEGYPLDIGYVELNPLGVSRLTDAGKQFKQISECQSRLDRFKYGSVILFGYPKALVLTSKNPLEKAKGLSRLLLQTSLTSEDDQNWYYEVNGVRDRLESSVSTTGSLPSLDRDNYTYVGLKTDVRDSSSIPLPKLVGASGSGLWADLNDGPTLLGVHSGLSDGRGRATKICHLAEFIRTSELE